MTEREWKQGDVAILSLVNGSETRALVDSFGWSDQSGMSWALEGSRGYTSARPLVVIDPEDREQVERLRASLERMSFSPWACGAATCLTTALREFANPTPPKPDEPTGLGAVVEDAKGYRFVRGYEDEGTHPWHIIDPAANHTFAWWKWSDIAAVRVLSEGVPS